MDRETFIQGLNEDLAHEYEAVITYTTFAARVKGPHRPALRAFFLEEAKEELEHAQFLADKIVALGGVPTTQPARIPEAETPRAMLEAILKAETETLARYAERMRQAEAFGDLGLAARIHAMIEDETEHKEEVEKHLLGFPG